MSVEFNEEIELNRFKLFKDHLLKLDQITIQPIELEDDTIDFLTIFFSIFFKKTDRYLGAFGSDSIKKVRERLIESKSQLSREQIQNRFGREYIYLGTRSRSTGRFTLINELLPLTDQIKMVIKLLELIVDFIYIENEDKKRLELYISRRYPVNILVQDSFTGSVIRERDSYLATALGDNYIGDQNYPYQNVETLRQFYNTDRFTNVPILDDILNQYNIRRGLYGANIPTNMRTLGSNIANLNMTDTINLEQNIQRQTGQLNLIQAQVQAQLPLITTNNINTIQNSTILIQPNLRTTNLENSTIFLFNQFLESEYETDEDSIHQYANLLSVGNVNDAVDSYTAEDLKEIVRVLVELHDRTQSRESKDKINSAIKVILSNLRRMRPDYKIMYITVGDELIVTITDEEEQAKNEEEELEQEQQRLLEEEQQRLKELEEIRDFQDNVNLLITEQNITYPERSYEENLLGALLVAREGVLKDYPDVTNFDNVVSAVMNNLNSRINEISDFIQNKVGELVPNNIVVNPATVALVPNDIGYRKSIIIGTIITIVLGAIASYFFARSFSIEPDNVSNIAEKIDNLNYAKNASQVALLYSTDQSKLTSLVQYISEQIPDSVKYWGPKTLSAVFAVATVQLLPKITGKLRTVTTNAYPLTVQIGSTLTTYFVYDHFFSNDGSIREVAKAAVATTSATANLVTAGAGAALGVVNSTAEFINTTSNFVNTIAESTVSVGDKITTLSEKAGGNFINYSGKLALIIAGVSLAYILYRAYYSKEEREHTIKLKVSKEDSNIL